MQNNEILDVNFLENHPGLAERIEKWIKYRRMGLYYPALDDKETIQSSATETGMESQEEWNSGER